MSDKLTLSPDWILKHIGNVGVDSGNVMLIDPVHKREIGVTSGTAEGDGICPTYQVYAGKALVGLFVSFLTDPPAEADGKTTLGNIEEQT
jgi:hypothetical protein